MKYLEREKSEWNLRKEYLDHQQKKLKNVLYIIVGLAVTLAVVFEFYRSFWKRISTMRGWD